MADLHEHGKLGHLHSGQAYDIAIVHRQLTLRVHHLEKENKELNVTIGRCYKENQGLLAAPDDPRYIDLQTAQMQHEELQDHYRDLEERIADRDGWIVQGLLLCKKFCS